MHFGLCQACLDLLADCDIQPPGCGEVIRTVGALVLSYVSFRILQRVPPLIFESIFMRGGPSIAVYRLGIPDGGRDLG